MLTEVPADPLNNICQASTYSKQHIHLSTVLEGLLALLSLVETLAFLDDRDFSSFSLPPGVLVTFLPVVHCIQRFVFVNFTSFGSVPTIRFLRSSLVVLDRTCRFFHRRRSFWCGRFGTWWCRF